MVGGCEAGVGQLLDRRCRSGDGWNVEAGDVFEFRWIRN